MTSLAKKILNCARVLVVLLAITMGFTIAISSQNQKATRIQPVPVNLDQLDQVRFNSINIKLDRIIEEGRARDTVILRQILELRQQEGPVPQDRIAKVSHN